MNPILKAIRDRGERTFGEAARRAEEATKRMKNSGVDRLLRLLILVVAAICAVNAFRFLGRMP